MESPLRDSIPSGTQLIETFGWTAKDGFRHLDLHLARMARSAFVLGIAYDEAHALYELQVEGDQPLRCRLTLGEEGFAFTSTPMTPVAGTWTLAIADTRLASTDPWLAHKSTQRAVYDDARAKLPQGIDELLFLNERDELCEGTITNLFVTLPDGQMVTPPLTCGLLPGILRQELLATGQAVESLVTRDMLDTADAIHLGNSLRGLIPAMLR